MRRLAISTATVLLLCGGATAQQRYQIERTEHGVVRLDTETGALTICRDEGGELTCRMAPDERAAYEKELDLLAKRVAVLEERFSTIRPDGGLPDDAEIDRSLSIMERFMRSFMGIVREFTGETSQEPRPDRT